MNLRKLTTPGLMENIPLLEYEKKKVEKMIKKYKDEELTQDYINLHAMYKELINIDNSLRICKDELEKRPDKNTKYILGM